MSKDIFTEKAMAQLLKKVLTRTEALELRLKVMGRHVLGSELRNFLADALNHDGMPVEVGSATLSAEYCSAGAGSDWPGWITFHGPTPEPLTMNGSLLGKPEGPTFYVDQHPGKDLLPLAAKALGLTVTDDGPATKAIAQQTKAKVADARRRKRAHAELDAMHLQLPSEAPLPPTHRRARDLQPGDRIIPLMRKDVHVVKDIELYGISCAISFEEGRTGCVVNPLQPFALQPAAKMPKAKRATGHQGGLVLEDGTLVADPANALLELHDQANGTPVARSPQPAMPTLGSVVAGLGANYREREVIKRRLGNLVRKVQRLPDAERRALLQLITLTT